MYQVTMSIGKYNIVTVGRIMKTSKMMSDFMTECVLSNTLLLEMEPQFFEQETLLPMMQPFLMVREQWGKRHLVSSVVMEGGL